MDSMQYRPSNANLDSGCQRVSIITGDNGCRHLFVVALADFLGHPIGALACLFVDCGIINVFCWSPNYAMQINELPI